MSGILNSYMITNRANPGGTSCGQIYPLAPWQNFYFWAPGANNSNASAYRQSNLDPELVMPPSYLSRLEADIVNAVNNGGPQVTLFIHGMSYLFPAACSLLGTFGQNLVNKGGYKGLLIGFSWPSYDSLESVAYYADPYTFPPQLTSRTIRDNINGSVKSLWVLLVQLAPLCRKHNAKLNIVCHSEGNYMLMLAMYVLSLSSDPAVSELAGSTRFIDQVLLLPADINNGALQSPQGYAGQGAPIAARANTVTVYWSKHDMMLQGSDGWTAWHNPSFPLRLGRHGLASYASGTILKNAIGLDCSQVANPNYAHYPPFTLVHDCYFYIQQILLDMAQTLSDVPPARVANRTPVPNQNQSFAMNPASGLLQSQSPFQPSLRCPVTAPAPA
jgi:hypothetical protein